jgi:hypothetical protein
MPGSAGLTGAAGIKAMLLVKVESLVVHETVRVAMAFATVRHPLNCFRVNYCHAFCVCAGIEEKKEYRHGQ